MLTAVTFQVSSHLLSEPANYSSWYWSSGWSFSVGSIAGLAVSPVWSSESGSLEMLQDFSFYTRTRLTGLARKVQRSKGGFSYSYPFLLLGWTSAVLYYCPIFCRPSSLLHYHHLCNCSSWVCPIHIWLLLSCSAPISCPRSSEGSPCLRCWQSTGAWKQESRLLGCGRPRSGRFTVVARASLIRNLRLGSIGQDWADRWWARTWSRLCLC